MPDYRDLLDLINEEEIDPKNRARLRAILVEIGGRPAESRSLVASLSTSNSGLETTRDLQHWVSILSDELGREIDDFRETTNFVLAPITAAGFGTPVAALAVIGAIGSGGVLLLALGGMAAAGGAIRGIVGLRRQRHLIEGDLSALKALAEQLEAFEQDLLRRQGR
jgi:hypothetical protein